MSTLLESNPFSRRDDNRFLAEAIGLTRHHLAASEVYRRIWPEWSGASCIADLPFLHVGMFKNIDFHGTNLTIKGRRTLLSSATTSGMSSRIPLDPESSGLQTRSSELILRDMVGDEQRPLLVLGSSKSLRMRREVSARVAAAMSLKPLASEIHFILDDDSDPDSLRWDKVLDVCTRHPQVLVYGFTWILWRAWAESRQADVKRQLKGTQIHFVHSGGWKKLEHLKVSRDRFDSALLCGLAPASRVVDYYGLVEQNGVIFPLCEAGARHVPRWADVLVRDPYTLDVFGQDVGMLQFVNVLARGVPYHSVLTEDMGHMLEDDCSCGRSGRRFNLVGRVPRSEVRGCANV